MTVIEAVQQALTSIPSLTAEVPAARIRPFGEWREMPAPWVVHGPIAVDPEDETHDSSETLEMYRSYQVSVFAKSFSDAHRIAAIIRSGLPGALPAGWSAFAAGGPWHISYEPEPGVHHVAADFLLIGG